jgi:hypothetical protein
VNIANINFLKFERNLFLLNSELTGVKTMKQNILELRIFKKKLQKDFELTTGLMHSEFLCKCSYKDCTYTLVNDRLLRSYKALRKKWNAPLFITSGFRCQRHNAASKGHKDSWHKKGSAIDLVPVNKGDLRLLYELATVFFDYVVLNEEHGFIHCENEF